MCDRHCFLAMVVAEDLFFILPVRWVVMVEAGKGKGEERGAKSEKMKIDEN